MKVLLPDSVDLDLTLPDTVLDVHYVINEPIPESHLDAEVLVVWGNPDEQLRDAAARLTRVRWVQSRATCWSPRAAACTTGRSPSTPWRWCWARHDGSTCW
jgi:hypothetical protein